jgi:uncharacterized protein
LKHVVLLRYAACWALCLCLFGITTGAAQTVQTVPTLSARVIDLAGALSAADKNTLEQLSARIEAQRGSQIAVLLVPSTQPEPIEDYTHRVASAWKLGRSGVGDGVLIVAALQDRKVRIEVARNLEGALPDATAKRMIREVIAPAFKQAQYVVGLEAALHRIDERLAQENLPLLTESQAGVNINGLPNFAAGFDIEVLVPLLVFGVVLGCILRTRLGGLGPVISALGATGLMWSLGYVLLMAVLLGLGVMILGFIFSSFPSALQRVGAASYRVGTGFPNNGAFGSFGTDRSSGGFTSGGGGDFSGGGSSGDW